MKKSSETTEHFSVRERFSIFFRGWKILLRYGGKLSAQYVVLYILQALSPFVNVWMSAFLLNELTGACRPEKLALFAALAVGLNFLLQTGIKMLDYNGFSYGYASGFMLDAGLRRMFAEKQLELDYTDLEDARVRELCKAVKEKTFFFGGGLNDLFWSIGPLISGLTSVIASVALTVSLFRSRGDAAWLNTAWWAVPMLGLILAGTLLVGRNERKSNRLYQNYVDGSGWLKRSFDFFGWELYSELPRAKDVRLYRQDRTAEKYLNGTAEGDRSLTHSIMRRLGLYNGAAALIFGLCYSLIYLFVVLKALSGAFGVGNVVQYVGALSLLSGGLRGIIEFAVDNRTTASHLRQLYTYLDIPSKKHDGRRPVPLLDGDWEIEFRDVSFRYPGTEKWALRHISLRLRPGERTAVVGMNGSGKTTFIKLLCRLYDPDEGAILLDGIDIREYDYEDYLRQFSVVFQDFSLFSFSLRENIAAAVDADDERVQDCLARAGFDERLTGMKDGLATNLYKDFDENGVEISGGEAQKIALARALYKNAPILVLDEPTAALDPIAECEVYTHFNETVGGKAAVYISHRLASCRFCDSILVFDEGKIVQRGTHEALLAEAGGRYTELWNAQAQYYV